MNDNPYVGGVDVFVRFHEVRADYRSKEFGRRDRVLLGENIASLLLRIGRDNDRVVALRVSEGAVRTCPSKYQ